MSGPRDQTTVRVLLLLGASLVMGPLIAIAAAAAQVWTSELVAGESIGGQTSFRAVGMQGDFEHRDTQDVKPWGPSAFTFATVGPNHVWTATSRGVRYRTMIGDPQRHLLLSPGWFGTGGDTVRVSGWGGGARDPLGQAMTWVKPYMELRFVVDVGWPLPYLTGEAMTASTEPQVMMLASYTPSSLTDTHGLAFMTTRRDHGGSVARAMPLRPILGPFIGVSLFHALCSLCLLLGVRSIWLRMNGPGTIPTS